MGKKFICCMRNYLEIFRFLWGGGTKDSTEILNGKSSSSRCLKLLQIMLAHVGKGISRASLLEYLYGKEEISNSSNNLRVTMHRLRRQLYEAGLPKSEYFLLDRATGTYHWDERISVKTDVQIFEEELESARQEKSAEKRAKFLRKACILYKGEFLEDMGLEEWVVVRAVKYKEKYKRAMRELLELLREKKEHEEIVQLCVKAVKLYPYDEWQEEMVDSLVQLGKKEDALQLCKDTSKMYWEELGIPVSARMTEQYHRLTGMFQGSVKDIQKIESQFKETRQETEALYLSFQSFVDIYRLLKRISEEGGRQVYVAVCSVWNPESLSGRPKRPERLSAYLRKALQASLKRDDAFTKYSDLEYLILLSGKDRESCEQIFNQVRRQFSKQSKSWARHLRFDLFPSIKE